MIHWWKTRKKAWRINVWHFGSLQVLEVTDSPFTWNNRCSDTYMDIIGHVFQGYEVMALSQFIDERQGLSNKIGNRQEFVERIQKVYPVQAEITNDYADPNPVKPESLTYVIHVVGQYCRPLFGQLLVFGTTSLPNIAYGLRTVPAAWPETVLVWNQSFVKWFRLIEPLTALAELTEKVGLLFWTADGHLFFASSEKSETDEILLYVLHLAAELDLRLVVEDTPRGHK